MEISDLSDELHKHEKASQHRHDSLHHEIKSLKGHEMQTPVNIFEGGGMGGAGAGLGAGLGGGLLGGILGGALLGNRGLLGGAGAVGECVTPMQLQTATGSIIDANQNTVLLQAVGDVKASVPLSAAQTQLAVAGSTDAIRSHLGQVENTVVALGQSNAKAIADAIASSLASQNNINLNISAQGAATREAVNANGTANLLATNSASAANLSAIANSTNLILTALKDNEITNLNRQLTVSELRNSEDRAEARARGTEVTVTQTVNQNQMQMQAQQQQQQLVNTVNGLCHLVGSLQSAVATNSNMIIGNTGAVATGPNTANPVNVRT